MFYKPAQPLTRARAVSCILVNQAATPGLGSLMAGRWLAGTGQLILAIAGFVMVLVWFFAVMIQYYGQVTGEVTVHSVWWIGVAGALLFVASWLWALITSISLWWATQTGNAPEFKPSSPPPPPSPGKPPKLST